MKGKHAGGITVFAVLTLSLVTGCILALLEGARIYELREVASLRTQMAMEAPFARYSSSLWERFHLLGNNVENLEELIIAGAESGYRENALGTNFLMLKLKNVELQEYTLLTDGEGIAYINAVSAYMSKNILYETAKMIYNRYEAIKELIENNSSDGTEISDALESLETLEKESRGGSYENPLETIEKLQKTQLLELVVEDTDTLSKLEYNLAETVSHRTLKEGKESDIEDTDWLDRVFLQQYLLTYLADYTHPASDRGLDYELEYLVGGKNNDIENLREVVNRLFFIREAANLAYLFSDVEKMETAQGLATLLAGATANAAVIEIVKIGIIVAWAFGESVLDVRALLLNKKIPLIKSKDTWTLGIEHLGEIGTDYLVAKECNYGISYKTYLGVLLLFQKDELLAYRGMDVQEMTLLKSPGSIRMDQLVVKARVKVTYEYVPVFYSFSNLSAENKRKGEICVRKSYGYY